MLTITAIPLYKVSLLLIFTMTQCDGQLYIDDFTQTSNTSTWEEVSDSVRNGFSKASFDIQQTRSLRRGVLFTLLNPLPNGAGFAGYGKNITLDASEYNTTSIQCRNQGQYNNYEFLLRHKGETDADGKPSYVYYFEAPTNSFDTLHLDFSDFQANYRGKPVPDADPLDKSKITKLEILAYAGVFREVKQKGVAALEIDWIRLDKEN